jgi:uncharacterized C2H2 Zn-finger protein
MTETELACPECGKTFGTSARLGAHRSRVHGYRSSRRGVARTREASPRSKRLSLRGDLRRVFQTVGVIVSVVDPYCGGVLANRSETFCDAVAALAARDPKIERWLRALSRAGPYGAIVLGAAEIAVPIAAHHGLLSPGIAVLLGAPMQEEPPSQGSEESHGGTNLVERAPASVDVAAR